MVSEILGTFHHPTPSCLCSLTYYYYLWRTPWSQPNHLAIDFCTCSGLLCVTFFYLEHMFPPPLSTCLVVGGSRTSSEHKGLRMERPNFTVCWWVFSAYGLQDLFICLPSLEFLECKGPKFPICLYFLSSKGQASCHKLYGIFVNIS